MKNLIILLSLLFTIGLNSQVKAQTGKKHKITKKHKVKKHTRQTAYRLQSTSGKRVIHTGPRGGRYYINSNGNKTYVK